MIVGIPKENTPGERRVALVPSGVTILTKAGFEVSVESGAGELAGHPDKEYVEKGANIVQGRSDLFSAADVLLMVQVPAGDTDESKSDLASLNKNKTVIGMMDPLSQPEAVERIAKTGARAFAMELIPRITRAQNMDVLSSMATLAGYKAVLYAATELPSLFPMLMTAAGTLAPARVFVIGVGVAGLQAIATARRLGAVVEAYDVRPAVKEQVQSVGAKFVELDLETGDAEDKGGYAKEQGEEFIRKQQEQMSKVIAENDVVITTAAIPGRKAPILVTAEQVKGMKPGSVIVDLAAERGGNCELCKAGETVVEHGVTIVGPLNIPSTVPTHGSQMYSKNLTNFMANMTKEGKLEIDHEDEIVASTLVSEGGQIVSARLREILGLPLQTPKGSEG